MYSWRRNAGTQVERLAGVDRARQFVAHDAARRSLKGTTIKDYMTLMSGGQPSTIPMDPDLQSRVGSFRSSPSRYHCQEMSIPRGWWSELSLRSIQVFRGDCDWGCAQVEGYQETNPACCDQGDVGRESLDPEARTSTTRA